MGDLFSENFKLDLIELFLKYEVIPEGVARNEKIKIRYRILKRELKSGKKAREQLANENFIAVKTVESILYPEKKLASTG